ncbi:MAG TPA: glycosyltransferase [Polyangiaceae bacterium]|nr:glycosyltransferase [Polyangiaceae bacterium]
MLVLLGPRLGFLGGVEAHVFDLANGLRARGHRVGYVHVGGEGRDAARFASGFDEVVNLARAASLLRNANVIYGHKVGERELMSVPSGKRVFVMIHDHDATCVRRHRYLPVTHSPCHRPPGAACVAHGCVVVRDRDRPAGVRLGDPFELARSTRRLAERATIVVASRYMKRTIEQAGVEPGRVRIIHPVPREWEEPTRPAPRLGRVAYFGQVIRGKGVDLLVRAIARTTGLELTIAGLGNALPSVKALVKRLGLSNRVHFLGPLRPEQLVEAYDSARVVAVPSRWPEPFGMVGIEAMRRARVVVGAMHGGIPEWLEHGETGYGFEPCDVGGLRNALLRAAFGSEYERLAESAQERARSGFGFARMVSEVERAMEGSDAS